MRPTARNQGPTPNWQQTAQPPANLVPAQTRPHPPRTEKQPSGQLRPQPILQAQNLVQPTGNPSQGIKLVTNPVPSTATNLCTSFQAHLQSQPSHPPQSLVIVPANSQPAAHLPTKSNLMPSPFPGSTAASVHRVLRAVHARMAAPDHKRKSDLEVESLS